MELEQIKELIAVVEGSKIKKLLIKKGDEELQIEKEGDVHSSGSRTVVEHLVESSFQHHGEQAKLDRSAKQGRHIEPVTEGTFITSPMVGTFYSSAGPDQPPFVKVGDRVTPDSVVCIVEAMKVMNEVKANVSGVVAEVLIDNAHPVEFGSKIFYVK